jgi:hypothetical protein
VAASAHGAGDQAIQPATDLVAAGLIASGIALRPARINWFCSRPGDKVNSPPSPPNGLVRGAWGDFAAEGDACWVLAM